MIRYDIRVVSSVLSEIDFKYIDFTLKFCCNRKIFSEKGNTPNNKYLLEISSIAYNAF